jgi:hypothetical protein
VSKKTWIGLIFINREMEEGRGKREEGRWEREQEMVTVGSREWGVWENGVYWGEYGV